MNTEYIDALKKRKADLDGAIMDAIADFEEETGFAFCVEGIDLSHSINVSGRKETIRVQTQIKL